MFGQKKIKEEIAQLNTEKENLELTLENLKNEIETMKKANINEAYDFSNYTKMNLEELNELRKQPVENLVEGEGREVEKIIRLFEAETNKLIGEINSNNVENITNKIAWSFKTINQLFSENNVRLKEEYLHLKIDQISIVYQEVNFRKRRGDFLEKGKEKLQEVKAIDNKHRERLERLRSDENELKEQIKEVASNLKRTDTPEIYLSKIEKIENNINKIRQEQDEIEAILEKSQSGWLYVISNKGSLGSNVYKIGVTRELNPYEEINRLYNNSVPFPFDINAILLCENAFTLLRIIHKRLESYRVNLVNENCDFFEVPFEEIKKVILEFEQNVIFSEKVSDEFSKTKEIFSSRLFA